MRRTVIGHGEVSKLAPAAAGCNDSHYIRRSSRGGVHFDRAYASKGGRSCDDAQMQKIRYPRHLYLVREMDSTTSLLCDERRAERV